MTSFHLPNEAELHRSSRPGTISHTERARVLRQRPAGQRLCRGDPARSAGILPPPSQLPPSDSKARFQVFLPKSALPLL